MGIYSTSSTIILTLICHQYFAKSIRESPCPEQFRYLNGTGENEWQGKVMLNFHQNSTGIQLRILLDKKAQLLTSEDGHIITNDNQLFVLFNPYLKSSSGDDKSISIAVKFGKTDPQNSEPRLKTIHFNGKQLCPASDKELILEPAGTFKPLPESNDHMLYHSKNSTDSSNSTSIHHLIDIDASDINADIIAERITQNTTNI